MATLAQAESAARVDYPPEIAVAIKALASDPQHRLAWAFIVETLCSTDRLSFALPDVSPTLMAWRQGRRFVGLMLREIVAKPVPEPEVKLPPARTKTEEARRRNATTTQG